MPLSKAAMQARIESRNILCKYCAAPFVAKRSTQFFCCADHSGKYERALTKAKCFHAERTGLKEEDYLFMIVPQKKKIMAAGMRD